MKSRITGLLIIFILITFLQVSATGEPAREQTSTELKVKIAPGIPEGVEIQPPPWMVDRCNFARTGRADVPGPGSAFVQTASTDLFSGVLSYPSSMSGGSILGETLNPAMRGSGKIHTLRVGRNNQLYFLDKLGYALYKWTFPDGQQWAYSDLAHYEIGLDALGRIHAMKKTYLPVMLCFASDGSVVGQQPLMEAGVGTGLYFCVGRNLYIRDEMLNTGTFNFARANMQGNIEWSTGTFDHKFHAVAEDASGNVYGRDTSPSLHKFDNDGNLLWSVPFPVEVGDNLHDTGLGPLIGADGRIWVGAANVTETTTMLPGMPYMVLNPDGTEYKKGSYGNKGLPVAACYGGNHRFFIGFTGSTPKVIAFDDWNQVVWNTALPAAEKLLDVIMDSDNNIYVAYSAFDVPTSQMVCNIAVLDPGNGTSKKIYKTDIPSEWASASTELAIGDSGRLYLLNSAGYLREYGKLEMSKNIIKVKPGI